VTVRTDLEDSVGLIKLSKLRYELVNERVSRQQITQSVSPPTQTARKQRSTANSRRQPYTTAHRVFSSRQWSATAGRTSL